MAPESSPTGQHGAPPTADEAVIDDLRSRLNGSRTQELAARTEARRLARELAVARRLLRFGAGNPPSRPRPVAVPAAAPSGDGIPRLRAALLTQPVIFHLDACQNEGAYTTISGWAFRPAPGWDGRATTVTLLFRQAAQTFEVAVGRMPRPDVATHFAAQGGRLAGGAVGLEGTGFGGELLHDSLPGGVELEIILRLECAGMVCEQPTGRRLRF